MNKFKKSEGFTLIELLIVVAIIGILAAIAIPNLLTAMQRARQKRSMADIRTVATAWEARATDMSSYAAAGLSWPDAGSSVTYLIPRLVPTYVTKIPEYDAWGLQFQIGITTAGDDYSIECLGADKLDQDNGTSATGPVTTNNFDCDIIFSQGNFVVYPEGVQSQ